MDQLPTQTFDHSSYIFAAFAIGFVAIGAFNLWLHLQRRKTLANLMALHK